MQSLLAPMEGLPGVKSIDTQEDTLAVKQIYCQRGAVQVPAAWHPLGTKQTRKGVNTEYRCTPKIQVRRTGYTLHPETNIKSLIHMIQYKILTRKSRQISQLQ